MKSSIRKLAYTRFFRELICNFFVAYMKLVYFTSRVKFVNEKILLEAAKNKEPLVILFWHNRLMMIPFIARKIKKTYPAYNFMTLASKHGDGQIVGRIMEKFNLISILGSTQSDHKQRSRGISIGSFKQIFSGLKKGHSLGITPDGPRGPNQKINGEVINIARMAESGILALSYSSSRFIELKTWDKFKLPLPFSKLCFYFDEKIFQVKKDCSNEDMASLEKEITNRINFTQDESQRLLKNF